MALTLDIAPLVRARAWLSVGAMVVLLIGWVETAVSIAALAVTPVFTPFGLVVLAAQHRILGFTRAALARASMEPWRAHAFSALALTFMLVASLAIADPVLRLTFAAYTLVLVYPVVRIVRAIGALARELRTVADPTFLNFWLFRGRPAVSPVLSRPRLGRAVPWFALTACCGVLLVVLFLIQQLEIVDFGTAGLGWPVAMAAIYFLNRGRRHIKLRAAELRSADGRAPVLILRTFKDDNRSVKGNALGSLTLGVRPTLEEILAYEADVLGPSITIGEPGEKLPPLGAARQYLLHRDWRATVSALIDEAALIVFVLGDSDNLRWEFSTTVRRQGLNAIVVVVPPPIAPSDRERRWQRFVQAHAALLGPDFPRQPPPKAVVAFFFDEGRTIMIASPGYGWWDYALAVRLVVGLSRRERTAEPSVEGYLARYAPVLVQGVPFGRVIDRR